MAPESPFLLQITPGGEGTGGIWFDVKLGAYQAHERGTMNHHWLMIKERLKTRTAKKTPKIYELGMVEKLLRLVQQTSEEMLTVGLVRCALRPPRQP